MHFATMDEALKWLNMPWHKTAGAVYNDSGLLVLFLKSPGREQITVDVFQVYIGAENQTEYPEARTGPFVRCLTSLRAMVALLNPRPAISPDPTGGWRDREGRGTGFVFPLAAV